MPLYKYVDKKTNKEVEVIRQFSEYEIAPTREEAKEMSDSEYTEAEWSRIVGDGIKVIRSWGYGSKGNWAILLGILLLGSFGPRLEAKAKLRLLEPTSLLFEASEIQNYREAYLPEYSVLGHQSSYEPEREHWRYGAAVLFDMDVVEYKGYRIFWGNRIHMDATEAQVRRVGWEWRAGVTLIPNKLEVFSYHHSEHWLEGYDQERQRFPVKDEYTVRLILLKK